MPSNDGGPAFPGTHKYIKLGMSLRQWYAGMALPIAFANLTPDEIAAYAVSIADALIRQTGDPDART